MKKILSVLVILALAAGVSYAQTENQEAQEEQAVEESGPVMTFESEVVDYGTIEQDSEPYRFFKFTNDGDEPLVIKNAKGSCGCTVPTYPKEPILPGESSEIKVRYDTKRIGKFTKTVTLTTNTAQERHVLRIKGEVLKKEEEPAGIPTSTGGFNQ
jgi:hypothetical protein